MSKYHHSPLQLCIRSFTQGAGLLATCVLCTLALVIALLYLNVNPQAGESGPLSAVVTAERKVGEIITGQKFPPAIYSPHLLDDPSQSEHELSITEQIIRNREYILKHRPPIVEQPPTEKDMPYDSLLDLVQKWHPDNPDIPTDFEEHLQHFDFGNPYERAIAEKYRDMEIPFKIFNVTDFNDVSRKWSDAYLRENLKHAGARAHVERSKNNHFMFWSYRGLRSGARGGFTPPTEIMSFMTFNDWLPLARDADARKLDNASEHFYFMSGADAHEHGRTFISRDLPLFSTEKNNFWITNTAANKGIQCRFGMRGVIAESHYDSGKNMVAMLRGAKRYIVTPPWTCDRLGIISDTKHPSYRHSVIDWSDMAQAQKNFNGVNAFDTVVRAGEVLYIPSFWFHYIVSLQYSIQCNSRSGFPPGRKGQEDIKKCFHESV